MDGARLRAAEATPSRTGVRAGGAALPRPALPRPALPRPALPRPWAPAFATRPRRAAPANAAPPRPAPANAARPRPTPAIAARPRPTPAIAARPRLARSPAARPRPARSPAARPRRAALALAALALLAPVPARADTTAAETLRTINAVRAAHGAPALRPDRRLARAARAHSRDMVARGYFEHVTPGGTDLRRRVARTGWTRHRRTWRLAENLAWGSGPLAAPAAIVDAWLNSPAHRRILLQRRLRVAGIGVVPGTPFGLPGATYTADFGS